MFAATSGDLGIYQIDVITGGVARVWWAHMSTIPRMQVFNGELYSISSAGMVGWIRVHRILDGSSVRNITVNYPLKGFRVAHSGLYLTSSYNVYRMNLTSTAIIWSGILSGWGNSPCLTSEYVFVPTLDSMMRQFELSTGRLIRVWSDNFRAAYSCDVTSVGRAGTLLVASAITAVNEYDIETGVKMREYGAGLSGNYQVFQVLGMASAAASGSPSANSDSSLIVTGNDNKIRLYDPASVYQYKGEFSNDVRLWRVDLYQDRVFVGVQDNTIRELNARTLELVRVYQGHEALVRSLLVTNTSLFTASHDRRILEWSLQNGSVIGSFVGCPEAINAVAVNSYGVFAGSLTFICQWDRFNGSLVRVITGLPHIFHVFVTDTYMLACGMDTLVRLYDLTQNMRFVRNYIVGNWVSEAFVVDDVLYGVRADGLLVRMNFSTGELLSQIRHDDEEVRTARILGTKLYTGTTDGRFLEWDIPTMNFTRTFSFPGNVVVGIGVHDSSALVVSTDLGYLVRYNLTSGMYQPFTQMHTGSIRAAARQNDTLFTGSSDKLIVAWNIENRGIIRIYRGHTAEILCLSVYGVLMVSGSTDTTVRVWHISTGATLFTLTAHTGGVNAVLIGENGIFTGSVDSTVRMWRSDTGENIRVFTGHTGQVNCLALSGLNLFSGGTDGTVRVWDIMSGGLKRVLTGHTGTVTSLATVSTFVLSASTDQTVRQWDFSSMNLRAVYNAMAPLNAIAVDMARAKIYGGTNKGAIDEWDLRLFQVTTLALNTIGYDRDSEFTSTKVIIMKNGDTIVQVPMSVLVIVGIVIGGSLILVISLTLIYIHKRRSIFTKTSVRTTPISDASMFQSAATSFTTSQPQETNMNTITFSNHELSIPVFLLSVWGQDFVQLNPLAQGGSSSIFECRILDANLRLRSRDHPVIVKFIAAVESAMPELQRVAFYQELSIMWRFRDHPNFVKVYAFSVDPVCFVLKYYPGNDLSCLIKGTSRALDVAYYSKHLVLSLCRQMTSAISYMHTFGICHCDLKPANIFLDLSDVGTVVAVIGDVGISRIIDDTNSRVNEFAVSSIRGLSVPYAGPEVFQRFRVRVRSSAPAVWKAGDVYALAMIIFSMLERKTPWSGHSIS